MNKQNKNKWNGRWNGNLNSYYTVDFKFKIKKLKVKKLFNNNSVLSNKNKMNKKNQLYLIKNILFILHRQEDKNDQSHAFHRSK